MKLSLGRPAGNQGDNVFTQALSRNVTVIMRWSHRDGFDNKQHDYRDIAAVCITWKGNALMRLARRFDTVLTGLKFGWKQWEMIQPILSAQAALCCLPHHGRYVIVRKRYRTDIQPAYDR